MHQVIGNIGRVLAYWALEELVSGGCAEVHKLKQSPSTEERYLVLGNNWLTNYVTRALGVLYDFYMAEISSDDVISVVVATALELLLEDDSMK